MDVERPATNSIAGIRIRFYTPAPSHRSVTIYLRNAAFAMLSIGLLIAALVFMFPVAEGAP